MTRHVFTNAQLQHVYASQSQDEGRNQKDTARFEGPVFYSYRTPVAVILPDIRGESVALCSSVKYSMATSQHVPSLSAFAGPAFSVPFMPGQWGGRYVGPSGQFPRAEEAARSHAGNLAHLVKRAMESAESMIRTVKRTGRPRSWQEAATADDFNGPDSGFELQRRAACDYAARFGLPAPSLADLPLDGGFSRYQAALAEWQAKEADPATQRKRAADRARREARQAWMDSHGDSILRAAGLHVGSRWDAEDIKEALRGIPATEAGADMLRERLKERRERFEREHAAEAARRAAEEAARVQARAEEAAAAEAAGMTLANWRIKWGADYHAAEAENRRLDVLRAVPADRAVWRAGGTPEYRGNVWGDDSATWRKCESGGDMLRIKPGNPDTLESARGAEVPVSHARRVWRHVLRIMCAGEFWQGSIRCGHFTVSHVSPDGWMKAGCHRFNRAEMLRIAAEIGEPVTCEDVAAFPALETEESAA